MRNRLVTSGVFAAVIAVVSWRTTSVVRSAVTDVDIADKPRRRQSQSRRPAACRGWLTAIPICRALRSRHADAARAARRHALVLTEDAAKKLEQQVAAQSEKLNAPIDANRAAPPSGGDGSPGPYGNVGGYNNFWLDPGSRYNSVDGVKRSSLIVDPQDGRVRR